MFDSIISVLYALAATGASNFNIPNMAGEVVEHAEKCDTINWTNGHYIVLYEDNQRGKLILLLEKEMQDTTSWKWKVESGSTRWYKQ